MSGICGVVTHDGSDPDAGTVRRMAEQVPYRGPAQLFTSEQAVLAQLSPGGLGAPAVDTDLVVVADSRLDNVAALAAELFPGREQSVSDGELIAAAYRRWGADCMGRLVGDFAAVIWDPDRVRCLAFRDPMGMRSLYYRLEPGRFLFATELHQLVKGAGLPARLNESRIVAYLIGDEGSPESTFYEGISRLAPAEVVSASPDGIRSRRFWDFDPAKSIRSRPPEEQLDAFRTVFTEAVRSRLSGPSATGLLLSGGVDSGAVAITAGWLGEQGLTRSPFRTFSWAFAELVDGDEREASRRITDHFGMPSHDVPADDAWPLSEFTDHSPHPDDPYFGVYQPLFDRAARAARAEGVTRLLTGDRGDEVVGGWVFDHLSPLKRLRWRSGLRDMRAHARRERRSLRGVAAQYVLAPLLRTDQAKRGLPTWVPRGLAQRTGLADMGRPEHSSSVGLPYPLDVRYGRIFGGAAVRTAVWAERTRSVFGVEHADPWSDRRVAETVLSLDPGLVQRGGRPKHIVPAALGRYGPDGLLRSSVDAQPDRLFERGFRERSAPAVRSMLQESVAAEHGYLDADALLDAYDRYVADGTVHHDFWWPLTLEIWLRRYWT